MQNLHHFKVQVVTDVVVGKTTALQLDHANDRITSGDISILIV